MHSTQWMAIIERLTPTSMNWSAPWVSGSCIFCQAKPWLPLWQPRLGLTEDSRITDFALELWTYQIHCLACLENLPSEFSHLHFPTYFINTVVWFILISWLHWPLSNRVCLCGLFTTIQLLRVVAFCEVGELNHIFTQSHRRSIFRLERTNKKDLKDK